MRRFIFNYGLAGQLGIMLLAPSDENGGDNSGGSSSDSGSSDGKGSSEGGNDGKSFSQADVDRIITDRISRAKAAKDAEWAEKFQGVSPEDVIAFKTSKADQDKANAEAFEKDKKYNEHLTKINSAHATEKAALTEKYSAAENRLKKTLTDNAIFGALSKHKLVERAAGQIAGLIGPNIKIKDLDTGEVEVIGKDGHFIPDEKGVPHTLDTFISSWLDKNSHFLVGSGGGSGYNGSSGSNGRTFTRSQLRDPAFYKANRDAILEAQKAGRIRNE